MENALSPKKEALIAGILALTPEQTVKFLRYAEMYLDGMPFDELCRLIKTETN